MLEVAGVDCEIYIFLCVLKQLRDEQVCDWEDEGRKSVAEIQNL
jgi:hypothetical protein